MNEIKKIRNDDDLVRTLNNTKARYSRVLGYCYYHHCWITITQYKKRQCVLKNCHHFRKEENSVYWQQLKKKKLRKKNKKNESLVFFN